ncbi:MAG: hypothetical protein ACFCVC_07470 [Acidimicrobiia bacterium]
MDDFVFFANDQVHIRPSANVASGDVAARTNAFTTTPEIRLDNGATVSGAGSTTYGDVIQMASGSSVQNAAYNTKQGPARRQPAWSYAGTDRPLRSQLGCDAG